MKKIDPKLYNLHPRITLRKTKKDIFIVMDRKSRIIMKDGYRILEIAKKIRAFEIGKNVSVLSDAPVCSKTQKFLTESNIAIKSL
tara:strand:- start:467 stop:721 length:255 start_codon:yes stop_codon:yes gene_type:complete